jgi:hypothetical protein
VHASGEACSVAEGAWPAGSGEWDAEPSPLDPPSPTPIIVLALLSSCRNLSEGGLRCAQLYGERLFPSPQRELEKR